MNRRLLGACLVSEPGVSVEREAFSTVVVMQANSNIDNCMNESCFIDCRVRERVRCGLLVGNPNTKMVPIMVRSDDTGQYNDWMGTDYGWAIRAHACFDCDCLWGKKARMNKKKAKEDDSQTNKIKRARTWARKCQFDE